MSKVTINDTTLTAIGNAIRTKTGKTNLLLPSEMPKEIESIQAKLEGIVVPNVKPTLNDYTWAEIKAITDVGDYIDYSKYNIKVGDTKTVHLDGTVKGVDLTGDWDVFVLGIDHNHELEGKGITFTFGRKNGKNICFNYFQMNSIATNTGGWEATMMRNETCVDLFNILPLELQSVIKTVTKYTDNKGGGTNKLSNITATQDKIFIPAEFEVQGKRYLANQYEQNYQKQYDYYRIGNSKGRYVHSNIEKTSSWFVRSCYESKPKEYCALLFSGAPAAGSATEGDGFAPCFVV